MISVKNLHVYYGLIEAVKGIDFEVKEGEIVSLIGSNGAGKSSTLKALLNSVKKTGDINFLGYDTRNHQTHTLGQHAPMRKFSSTVKLMKILRPSGTNESPC